MRAQAWRALGFMAAAVVLLALAPMAAPQGGDPESNVSESDFNTNVSDPNDDYLSDEYDTNESAGRDGNLTRASGGGDDASVNESDFDTTVPSPDDGYLDDEYGTDTGQGTAKAPTPGVGIAGWVATAGVAAVAIARRRSRQP